MRFTSSVAAAAAITAVSAAPAPARVQPRDQTLKLPLKYINNPQSAQSVVDSGRAKLQKINGQAGNVRRQSSGTVTNDDVSYVASISIGSNSYSLIVDTGSSNLWCGARSSCEPSSGGSDTGNTVKVSYGSGSFSGEEYTDTVSFAGLSVNGQSLGSATSSTGFNNVDGIIGFGPVDLTQNTVSGQSEVPTFMDNLYSQGTIPTELLGVYFAPESGSDNDDANGELTLGGVDSSKFSGSLEYYPTLTSGNAAAYWGIQVAGFSYGGNSLSSGASGIVDTGTTLIYIPQNAYNNFLSATGGSDNGGFTSFSTAPTENFGITFGSTTYTLTPEQYLVPQDQYSNFQLASGSYYSWINNGGASGVATIIGQKFLENYYSAFDTTNSQIGFAST